jgi:hypothetical protein
MSSNPFQAPPGSYPPYAPVASGPPPLAMILAIISLATGVMGLLAFPGTCCLFLPMPLISLVTGVPVLFLPYKSAKMVAIVGLVFAGLSVMAIIAAIVLRATGVITIR